MFLRKISDLVDMFMWTWILAFSLAPAPAGMVSNQQVQVDTAVKGAATCRPQDIPTEFIATYSECYLGNGIDACDAMYKFGTFAQVRGVQKLDEYLKKKSGSLPDRIRKAIISDYGDSIHSDWKKQWAQRTQQDPALSAAEEKMKKKYESEGRTLVTGSGHNPPRYKVDPSSPGKFYDIANLSFDQLPASYQADSSAAAEQAIDAFFETYRKDPSAIDFKDPAKVDKMAAIFHEQWIERNKSLPWVTGDPELENRIRDANGIPRNKALPKRLVSDEVIANRELMKKWSELNRPFSALPDSIKDLNRTGVRQVSSMFGSRYVNRLGKTASYVRAGAQSAAAKLRINKAIKYWGGWKLLDLPLTAAMATADATPTACDEEIHRYAAYNPETCDTVPKIDEGVLNFLAESPQTQAKLLAQNPALCNYYKDLSDKLYHQVETNAKNVSQIAELTCNSKSDYTVDMQKRNERREYILGADGNVSKIVITPRTEMKPPRRYEVSYSPQGDIRIKYFYNNNVMSERTGDELAHSKADNYYSTDQFSPDSIDRDTGDLSMSNVFYTAKISQHLLAPVRACCTQSNVPSRTCLLQQQNLAIKDMSEEIETLHKATEWVKENSGLE